MNQEIDTIINEALEKYNIEQMKESIYYKQNTIERLVDISDKKCDNCKKIAIYKFKNQNFFCWFHAYKEKK